MISYVALIRGINVGGRNSLPMKDLKQLLERLDCSEVRTYIQSGNVVFRSSAPSARICQDIANSIEVNVGFRPHVVVLQESEFKRTIADNPFPEGESNPKALHFGFLEFVPSSPQLQELEALKVPSEKFALVGRVFYLFAPKGVGRSKIAAKSEKLLGVPMTDRNGNTISKILSILEEMNSQTLKKQ
ncbi:MAG: DUF1697 domain-containing protein [Pirellulaceae bacterium]